MQAGLPCPLDAHLGVVDEHRLDRLDLQRQLITDKLVARPELALELMWRFMGLTEPVMNRVDDSHGDVGDVFRQACQDLGTIAAKAAPDPVRLADRVFGFQFVG